MSSVFYFSCHMIYFFVAMQSENTFEKCLKVRYFWNQSLGYPLLKKFRPSIVYVVYYFYFTLSHKKQKHESQLRWNNAWDFYQTICDNYIPVLSLRPNLRLNLVSTILWIAKKFETKNSLRFETKTWDKIWSQQVLWIPAQRCTRKRLQYTMGDNIISEAFYGQLGPF